MFEYQFSYANMDTQPEITLAKREIFLNLDIVCSIMNNYDYLSSKDRYCVKRLINRISQTKYLQPAQKSDILTQLKLHRKNYLGNIYSSDILTGTIVMFIAIPQMWRPNVAGWHTYTYKFSVIWKTSDPKPVIRSDKLFDFICSDNEANLSDIFSTGWIWNIRGCAGVLKTADNQISIFCKDTGYFSVKRKNEIRTTYTHYKDGKIHCDNYPAIIGYDNTQNKIYEKWYTYGNVNKIIVYTYRGKIFREFWCRDDKLHRDDGPAKIDYFCSGKVYRSIWYRNGKIHRDDDKPAYTELYANGLPKYAIWCKDSIVNRESGPSSIIWDRKDNMVQNFSTGDIGKFVKLLDFRPSYYC